MVHYAAFPHREKTEKEKRKEERIRKRMEKNSEMYLSFMKDFKSGRIPEVYLYQTGILALMPPNIEDTKYTRALMDQLNQSWTRDGFKSTNYAILGAKSKGLISEHDMIELMKLTRDVRAIRAGYGLIEDCRSADVFLLM